MTDKKTDEFSEQEMRRRFEAALKGARLAGHVPMKAKKAEKKTKPKKKDRPLR